MSNSVRPHRRQLTRLPRPWDSPGKNTGVGCHFFSNAWKWKVKVKLLSLVRLFGSPRTAPYQTPLSMEFPRARVLEWVAVAFSGDAGSIPGSGRSPRIGNGNPFQDSCLKKSHGQRNLVCYSPWSRKESDNNWASTYRWLIIWVNHDCFHFLSAVRSNMTIQKKEDGREGLRDLKGQEKIQNFF